MGNQRKPSKATKTQSSEHATVEEPLRKEDQDRRLKIEDAFLKLCGVRKELLSGKSKLLDPDRVMNLGNVLRCVRPKLLPRDADMVQTILTKIPWHTEKRCFTISAADISLLGSIVKSIPNAVIFSIMEKGSFQHPIIDQYCARHTQERIRIPGQTQSHTWEELRNCETEIHETLQTFQEDGGILSSLENSVAYVRYREHFLSIKCTCCGVGGAASARHFIGQGETHDGFTKLWAAVASGERCRLTKKDAEDVLSFWEKIGDVYAIKQGDGPDWLPLPIETEDLEFMQGLEDLRSLVRMEDLLGHSWQKMTDHMRDWNRASHNGEREVWESKPPEKAPNPTPALDFADPEIKDAVDKLDCFESAHMFKYWVDNYPPEVSDALVLSSRSVTELYKNVGRKLRDAEDHFRRTRGGNETVTLKAIEAVSIHRSNVALRRRLEYAERQMRLQEDALDMRNSVNHKLTHLYLLYQKKLQELQCITSTKRFYLYGDALHDQWAAGRELGRLKIHYELQTNKLELLQEELSLVATMNYASQRRILILEDILKSIGGACSHHDGPVKPDSTNWNAIQKDIETRKQAVYRALKKSVTSQFEAQPLKGSQDWLFLELLYEHVLEKEPKIVERFTQMVYGSCIEIIRGKSVVGESCKQFLSKIKPQKGGNDVDPKLLEELCLATGWRTYLPADMTDCCNHTEGSWVNSYEIEVVREELSDALSENEELLNELISCQDVRDAAFKEAQKWREHFDLHLSICKKESAREDGANTRFQEWINNTYRILVAADEQNMEFKPEKEKMIAISERARAAIKERDDALRKNEPLLISIVQKDKVIDEKIREVARALESRGAHQEALSSNIKKLESMVEVKGCEVEKARKEVDQNKEEWNKKIQRYNDKIRRSEEKLIAKTTEFNTMKLDYEATQSQVETTKKDAARYKKILQDASVKFKAMEKERDESKMTLRSLRSNEQAENDRMKKAVRDAEAPKDALIAELTKEINKLNHDRRMDEATIRELLRLKADYKLKDLDLAAYESHVVATDQLLEANKEEIRDLRDQLASMEALFESMTCG